MTHFVKSVTEAVAMGHPDEWLTLYDFERPGAADILKAERRDFEINRDLFRLRKTGIPFRYFPSLWPFPR